MINPRQWGFDGLQLAGDIVVTRHAQDGPAGAVLNSQASWRTDDNYLDKKSRSSGMQRVLSMTLQLSSPSEYDGGELQLAGHGNLPRHRGTAFVFPSYLPRRVLPVTRGDYWHLVVSWSVDIRGLRAYLNTAEYSLMQTSVTGRDATIVQSALGDLVAARVYLADGNVSTAVSFWERALEMSSSDINSDATTLRQIKSKLSFAKTECMGKTQKKCAAAVLKKFKARSRRLARTDETASPQDVDVDSSTQSQSDQCNNPSTQASSKHTVTEGSRGRAPVPQLPWNNSMLLHIGEVGELAAPFIVRDSPAKSWAAVSDTKRRWTVPYLASKCNSTSAYRASNDPEFLHFKVDRYTGELAMRNKMFWQAHDAWRNGEQDVHPNVRSRTMQRKHFRWEEPHEYTSDDHPLDFNKLLAAEEAIQSGQEPDRYYYSNEDLGSNDGERPPRVCSAFACAGT